jgi:3-oxoacyl-[acyl-carrier protein] reductase
MSLEANDPTDWYRVIDVNLHGAFHCLREAGRLMLEGGRGCVVNMSSVAAERGGVRRAAYCASKAALNALTRVAAVEWGPRGVRVNAVGPGYCETPLLATAVEQGAFSVEDVTSRVPLGRLGASEDVAAAVAFLASPAAAYVNGQILYVDGGFLVGYGVGVASAQDAVLTDRPQR